MEAQLFNELDIFRTEAIFFDSMIKSDYSYVKSLTDHMEFLLQEFKHLERQNGNDPKTKRDLEKGMSLTSDLMQKGLRISSVLLGVDKKIQRNMNYFDSILEAPLEDDEKAELRQINKEVLNCIIKSAQGDMTPDDFFKINAYTVRRLELIVPKIDEMCFNGLDMSLLNGQIEDIKRIVVSENCTRPAINQYAASCKEAKDFYAEVSKAIGGEGK